MRKLLIFCLVSISLVASANIETYKENAVRVTPSAPNTVASYSNILQDARKSVVNISTQKSVSMQNPLSPFLNDPFFRQFFGERNLQMPKERIERSLGSGVIITKDGYIVTNNHVIDRADKILVSLPNDKKEYEAKIIGTDPKSDLAVIKIEAKNLPAIKFFDSNKVEVGDVVFAIGNPFGVGETITSGIVSATNRSSVGITEYEDFIQTDAAINPGNSGGALINTTGALIGINSAILTRSGASHGVGFSIPSNMVKNIVSTLIDKGEVIRAWLGVSLGNVDENIEEFYGRKNGALIMGVEPKSPADKAGIKRGDLIIEVAGKKIDDFIELRNTIGSLAPDQSVKIVLIRDKKTVAVQVKLGSQDKQATSTKSTNDYKGLVVTALNDQSRNQLGLSADQKGVIVSEVAENSDASKAGFIIGDVIVQIESSEIASVAEFEKAVKGANKKRFYIVRNRAVLMIAL